MSRVLSTLLMIGLACVIGVSTASAFPGQKGHKKDGAKKAHKTLEEIFKAKDKNNDGKLTEEEFIGKVKKEEVVKKLKDRFAKLDKDKDGTLTLEEFSAPRKHHKKKNK